MRAWAARASSSKPDGESPLAEAVVYQSGKIFNATRTGQNKGRNYLRVFFSRE